MCWLRYLGRCLSVGFPVAKLAGRERTGESWRRWPVECLPTLFFSLGPSAGLPHVPGPDPARGAEQEGPYSQPDRSSAEGALSQSCTQCTRRILFLGFCVCEEEEEEEELTRLDIGVFSARHSQPPVLRLETTFLFQEFWKKIWKFIFEL